MYGFSSWVGSGGLGYAIYVWPMLQLCYCSLNQSGIELIFGTNSSAPVQIMPAMDLSQGKLFDSKDLEAAKRRRISLASNSSGKASEKVRVLGWQQQCGWIRVWLKQGLALASWMFAKE